MDCLKPYEYFLTTTPVPNNGNLRYIIGDPEMNLLFINLKDVFPANYQLQSYLTPTITVNANWPTFLVSSLKIKTTSNQITIKLDYPADEIYEGTYTGTVYLFSDGVVLCGTYTFTL